MGTESPKQPLDDKTRIRIALAQGKYNKLLAQEAEAALTEVVMMILEDENVPEPLKEAVRGRYEGCVERREGLVEREVVECEQLIRAKAGN